MSKREVVERCSIQHDVELNEVNEFLYSFLNIFLVEADEAFGAEFLYGKAGHCAPEDDGAFHVLKAGVFRTREVTDESPCETVAGAGWIVNVLKRKSGSEKHFILIK